MGGEAEADIVERLREQPTMSSFANIGDMVGRLNHEREEAANEIERLREALRYYAKNHYPDIDAGPWGPNSNDWGDVARAALGEKE